MQHVVKRIAFVHCGSLRHEFYCEIKFKKSTQVACKKSGRESDAVSEDTLSPSRPVLESESGFFVAPTFQWRGTLLPGSTPSSEGVVDQFPTVCVGAVAELAEVELDLAVAELEVVAVLVVEGIVRVLGAVGRATDLVHGFSFS